MKPNIDSSLDEAIQELLAKYDLPQLHDDLVKYVREGVLTERLEKQLENEKCREVMDILWDAQLELARDMGDSVDRNSRGSVPASQPETIRLGWRFAIAAVTLFIITSGAVTSAVSTFQVTSAVNRSTNFLVQKLDRMEEKLQPRASANLPQETREHSNSRTLASAAGLDSWSVASVANRRSGYTNRHEGPGYWSMGQGGSVYFLLDKRLAISATATEIEVFTGREQSVQEFKDVATTSMQNVAPSIKPEKLGPNLIAFFGISSSESAELKRLLGQPVTLPRPTVSVELLMAAPPEPAAAEEASSSPPPAPAAEAPQ